jgi:hypothetical protein
MKQKLEQYLKESLKRRPDVWTLRIQNVHFCPTPADFIVLTNKNRYLIECKQVEYVNDKSSFSFDRLKQADSLRDFLIHEDNKAGLLLMFWNGRLNKSLIYYLPIEVYSQLKLILNSLGRKSINVEFLRQYCIDYQVQVVDGYIDIKL